MRTKQRNDNEASYVIRERGTRQAHFSDYEQIPQASNVNIPPEYRDDPDLYRAIMASLDAGGSGAKNEQKIDDELDVMVRN